MTNVIQFTPRPRDTELQIPQADSTRGDISTKVSNITDAHIPEFYLDRHTRPEYPAQEFFDVIIAAYRRRKKPIIIIHDKGYEPDCIVEISAKDGTRYQLPGSYFYTLIERYPIPDIQDYTGLLSHLLDRLGMTPDFHQETNELLDAKMDEFIGKTSSPATGYICEVYTDNRSNIVGSIGTENFINREGLTLLDLMVGAIYDMALHKIDIFQANMNIKYKNGKENNIVTLPARMLLTIIYRAIKNLHSLYPNFKNDNLLQWYMDEYIATWFRSEDKLEI